MKKIITLFFCLFFMFGCVNQSKVCTMDAKVCPDGSSVGRNPDNNCEFDPCPTSDQIACTKDAKLCPDGTTVVRDPENNCEFDPCPEIINQDGEINLITASIGMQSEECNDESYVNFNADYIIKGILGEGLAETKEENVIVTNYDFTITNVLKGEIKNEKTIIQVPGGAVGDLAMTESGSPIMKSGETAKIYIVDAGFGQYSTICGSEGIKYEKEITLEDLEPDEEQDINTFMATEAQSKKIAYDFIIDSPTYTYDGFSVVFKSSTPLKCQSCWEITYLFRTKDTGFGDRIGQEVEQKIVTRTAKINVVLGQVESAILDDQWDMINHEFIQVKI